MSSEHPLWFRVNSALLPQFEGKKVRLVCKPIKKIANNWTVQAPDGGEVSVTVFEDLLRTDRFFEVMGHAVNGTTIKLLKAQDLGDEVDMTLVDDTIKLMHDQRFSHIFSQ